MITVIVGTHKTRIKTPGVREVLSWEDMAITEIATLASTPSLLGDTRVLVLEGALSNERADEFFSILDGLLASPHLFIFEEEKLLKKPATLLAEKKVEVHVAPVEKKEAAESFNVFSIANAFALRDRKKMWLLLNAALQSNAAPEAVAGMLHWKVRDLLLKGSAAYTKAELRTLSRRLVVLYHESHRGGGELALLLERFILQV